MDVTSNIALSRLMALREQMEVSANNIANMNTSGYKAVEMQFAEDKMKAKAEDVSPASNSGYSMVANLGTYRDTSQGAIRQTGNPLDVAIQGEGYFSVKQSNGELRYTRNGVFQMNSEGQLVDLSGNLVQGTGGDITIPKGSTAVNIGKDGTVATSKGIVGKLSLMKFKDEKALTLDGNNGLKAPEGAGPQEVDNPMIVQGAVEASNVNTVKTMTQMIEIQRQYQAAANMMSDKQDLSRSAIKSMSKL